MSLVVMDVAVMVIVCGHHGWTWLDLATQIRLEPDLGRTYFGITEQCSS